MICYSSFFGKYLYLPMEAGGLAGVSIHSAAKSLVDLPHHLKYFLVNRRVYVQTLGFGSLRGIFRMKKVTGTKKEWNEQTQVIHQQKQSLTSDNRSVVSPIYTSVKYYFDSMSKAEDLVGGSREGYLYGRILNPTVRELELNLAQLQNTEDGLCTSSGMSALSTFMFGLLKSGDHVVYMRESYKPTRALIQKMLHRFGIEGTMTSILDHAGIEKAIKPGQTKILIWESPTNPQLDIADLNFLVGLCKKHQIISVMDNTFSGLHNHRGVGVDLYIHSLTKFASGHSDAMGGVILGSKALVNRIRWGAFELGANLSPREAAAISKGLKTYFLRYERSCQNALKIAEFLSSHPKVDKVRYPGLITHPQHQLAKKQQKDFGAVIMFEVKGGKPEAYGFIDRLKLFKAAPSLGSVESLVLPVELFFTGHLSDDDVIACGLSPSAIRISVGVEDINDLIFDLDSALA